MLPAELHDVARGAGVCGCPHDAVDQIVDVDGAEQALPARRQQEPCWLASPQGFRYVADDLGGGEWRVTFVPAGQSRPPWVRVINWWS